MDKYLIVEKSKINLLQVEGLEETKLVRGIDPKIILVQTPDNNLNVTLNKTQLVTQPIEHQIRTSNVTFTDLFDVPSSFHGHEGEFLAVNSTGTALEFRALPTEDDSLIGIIMGCS